MSDAVTVWAQELSKLLPGAVPRTPGSLPYQPRSPTADAHREVSRPEPGLLGHGRAVPGASDDEGSGTSDMGAQTKTASEMPRVTPKVPLAHVDMIGLKLDMPSRRIAGTADCSANEVPGVAEVPLSATEMSESFALETPAHRSANKMLGMADVPVHATEMSESFALETGRVELDVSSQRIAGTADCSANKMLGMGEVPLHAPEISESFAMETGGLDISSSRIAGPADRSAHGVLGMAEVPVHATEMSESIPLKTRRVELDISSPRIAGTADRFAHELPGSAEVPLDAIELPHVEWQEASQAQRAMPGMDTTAVEIAEELMVGISPAAEMLREGGKGTGVSDDSPSARVLPGEASGDEGQDLVAKKSLISSISVFSHLICFLLGKSRIN